ncbi:hypothetical protein ACIF70_18365 [Actinacidiphila glaucinigra]|uniref:hypothetical protein n=1 Tax=Actinacidiphila glaucinigra TaxID=235986 RepID=UPI0037CB3425
MPSQTTSEDDETTSVAERLKNLFKRHKKIIIGGTVIAVAAGALIIRAKGQGVTEDSESSPDPAVEDQKRQSPCEHPVSGYERMTKYGPQTVGDYVRGGSRA